jgi:hypothetical protein
VFDINLWFEVFLFYCTLCPFIMLVGREFYNVCTFCTEIRIC